jgi:hypothetical protein
MEVRVSLPEGTQQIQFPVLHTGVASHLRQFTIYFSEEGKLLLADFLNCPLIQAIQFELLSPTEGVIFQMQCAENVDERPSDVRIDSAGSFQKNGIVAAGLFSGSWHFQVPGKLPAVPFRLSVRFS